MRDIRFLLKTHYAASRALIIGINKYVSAPPLSYAVSDAVAIRDILIEKFKFPESNVTLLTNDAATKQTILREFLRFSNDHIELDDRVVVFFAGHGHTRTGSRGEIGYLVPFDADMQDFSTFIRWDELTRNVDLIRAKHVLFIMDACYGGLALVRGTAPGSARFLKDMMLRTARQVLTAGKADEVVADSGGPLPNHSVFTGHLIEALEGKAASSEGVLTANAVMSYVYAKVSSDKNSQQTPHYGHIDGDGDMILLAPGLAELDATETKDLDRLFSLPYVEPEAETVGSESKIRRIKDLIATESGAIQLHDLLTTEVRRFLALTAEDNFKLSGPFSQTEFISRLERYEAAVSDLSILQACVAHWGRPVHLAALQKSIARSSDRLESTGGLVAWIALRWYPLLIELYAAGIAAVDARRFDSLASLFNTPLPGSEYQQKSETFLQAAADAVLELNRSDVLKQIPGHERNHTPLSEYLFKILQPRLDDALFLGKSYESAFDMFEIYFALAAADARISRGQHVWFPAGRFGWKRDRENSPLQRVVREAEASKTEWPPLKAGFFGGDFERFKKVADQVAQFTTKLNWY